MFKVNNKDIRTTPRFTPCSSVSLVNFEYVVAGWDFVILLRQSFKIRNYIHENLVRKFSHVLIIWGSFFPQRLFFLLLIKLFHDQLLSCFIVCTFFCKSKVFTFFQKALLSVIPNILRLVKNSLVSVLFGPRLLLLASHLEYEILFLSLGFLLISLLIFFY